MRSSITVIIMWNWVHLLHRHQTVPGAATAPLASMPNFVEATAPLEGILSHVYYIKHLHSVKSEPDNESRKAEGNNKVKYPAYRKLYKKFLYFRHFINPSEPLIVCEGKTDNIYLRSALKALDPAYPQLAEVKGGKLFTKIRFLKHSRTEHDILELSGGTGNIAKFIAHYKAGVFKYKFRPMKFPIIIVADNNSGQLGGGGVFSEANKLLKGSGAISLTTTNDFYYLCHNLYLVKTPEIGATGESCMENLFEASVLAKTLDGKTFNPKSDQDTATQYGKVIFADKVVRANYDKINFSKFA